MKDFSRKMIRGDVTGVQQYYEKAQEEGCHLSCRVAQFRPALRNIEECEAGKHKELPPLLPMKQTLSKYLRGKGVPRLKSRADLE